MIKLLVSGLAFGVMAMPAMAADISPYNKAPLPLFSWTGYYVGGDIGGAWGSQGVLNTSPVSVGPLTQAPANATAQAAASSAAAIWVAISSGCLPS
jgi:outer membrane immunogenic protein